MGFIENVKRLCIADFPEDGLTAEQKTLRDAVKLFITGDERRSEKLFRELLSATRDDGIGDVAWDLLFAILVWQDRFDELSAAGLPLNEEDAERATLYDTRDTEFHLSPELTEVDMPEFPLIQPIMTVRMNGENVDMVIDTGAMFTIVTASVAERCGLAGEESTVRANGATGSSVAMRTTRIGELVIGKSIIKNKRCMIMPDEALDFSAVGCPKIKGIIGGEIIRALYWEIDYRNRRVRMRAPRQEDAERNMCCDFYPMVKAVVNGNETIVTAFDTGGDTTNFGMSMVGRFPGAEETECRYVGAGQSEASENRGFMILELPIRIAGAEAIQTDVFVHADREYSHARTLILPGSLGSDAAAGRTLIIDYRNRHLSIR